MHTDDGRPWIDLSVVVPAHDEEANLEALWARVRPVLDEAGACELIVVDDGSRDGTWAKICELAAADDRVVGLRLSRNFGQQGALTAGLEAAQGRAVACIDADLQDPPELLLDMLERWRDGAEVVYGVRRHRAGSLPKRIAYRAFYRLYRSLAEIEVPLDSGDFALLDRRVVDELVGLPERTRFLRGLRTWVGFRQEAFEYDRPDREAGAPSYTLSKLVRLGVDGLVSLSSFPLRLASILGMLVALAGVVYVGVAVVAKVAGADIPPGWTSLMAVTLVLGGSQLLVIGVLGEYVARIYEEVKRRPHSVVRDRVGPDGR